MVVHTPRRGRIGCPQIGELRGSGRLVATNLEGMRLRNAIATLAGVISIAVVTPAADGPLRWTWPLAYGSPSIVNHFEPPAEPWQAGHRGVDLAGIGGEPVYAAGAGVVTYAGLVAGVGVVSVNHGELRTTYQPVAATVRAGERVQAGQRIGTLDVTGSHCAPSPCLHWGLLRGDVYLDPTSLIPPTERPRARLLPLGPAALGDDRPEAREDGDRLTAGDGRLPAGDPGTLVRPGRVSGRAAIGALAGVGER